MLTSTTCSIGLKMVKAVLTWFEGAEGGHSLAERSTCTLLFTVLFIAVHLHFLFSLLTAGL